MIETNEDNYFYCAHCKHAWLKSTADHNLYIRHVKECLDMHMANLRQGGMVSFADNTYPVRRIERTRYREEEFDEATLPTYTRSPELW